LAGALLSLLAASVHLSPLALDQSFSWAIIYQKQHTQVPGCMSWHASLLKVYLKTSTFFRLHKIGNIFYVARAIAIT
jgi:hypothetical protein